MKFINSFFLNQRLYTKLLVRGLIGVCFVFFSNQNIIANPMILADGECYFIKSINGIGNTGTRTSSAPAPAYTGQFEIGINPVQCYSETTHVLTYVVSWNYYQPNLRIYKWDKQYRRWYTAGSACFPPNIHPAVPTQFTNFDWYDTYNLPFPADGCNSLDFCKEKREQLIVDCKGEENISSDLDESNCPYTCKPKCEWANAASNPECNPEDNEGPPDCEQ